MIDIRSLVGHSLWIFGAAIVLAAWSYASDVRVRGGVATWQSPGVGRAGAAGLTLAAAGIASFALPWWERGLWIGVLAASALSVLRSRSA